MNRRQLAAAGVAVAVALTGLVGAIGAMGLSMPGDTQAPEDTPVDDVEETRILDESLPLSADADQVLRGETPLDPGTELTVRLRSSGENPFIRSAETTVDDDGTFAATFDLSSVDAGTETRLTVRHDGEELLNRTLTVEAGEQASDDDETTTGASIVDYDGDRLTLASASDQAVTGTVDVAAGEEVTVRLRSSDSQQPFIKQSTTTVDEDGRFEATFDLSGIDPGVAFTVVVRHDGEQLTELDGAIAEE